MPETRTPLNMPFKTDEVVEQDPATLAKTLAVDVAASLHGAIKKRGQATLVVSGGSTPLPFFKALAQMDLPWDKVTVTLADERWVDADHADSNEKFVRENLLTANAAAAKFVSLKNPSATPEAGWQQTEAVISALPRPLDVVVLGMGGDGHTASLFPGAAGLVQAMALDCGRSAWPMNPPETAQARMSLTLDTLIDAHHLLLHITGEQKRAVLQKAATAAATTYPIAAVLKSAGDRLKVYWAP